MLLLDTFLSNNLIHWVPNPAYGIKPKAPHALPEGMSHLLLSSSFPIHKLLHQLVMLYPETGSTRMGHCTMHHDDRIPMEKRFDWSNFKKLISNFTVAAEEFASGGRSETTSGKDKGHVFAPGQLEPGRTWTEAITQRWDRFFEVDAIMKAADEADLIFGAWRTDQYKAGCHLAVISAYVLHAFWYARSDRQAWLQRFLTAVTSVHAVHAPIIDALKTDWPVYSMWQGLYALRRERSDLPSGPLVDAELLKGFLGTTRQDEKPKKPLFLTHAFGWMSRYLYNVKSRFELWGAQLLVLTDPGVCSHDDVWCVPTFPSLLVKYDVLVFFAELGVPVCWVDLDIAWFRDPTPLLVGAHKLLPSPAEGGAPTKKIHLDLVFASKDLFGIGVSPALLFVPAIPVAEREQQRSAAPEAGGDEEDDFEYEEVEELVPAQESYDQTQYDPVTGEEVVERDDANVAGAKAVVVEQEQQEEENPKAKQETQTVGGDHPDSEHADGVSLPKDDSIVLAARKNKTSARSDEMQFTIQKKRVKKPKRKTGSLVLAVLRQVRQTLKLNPYGSDLAMWDCILGREGSDDVGGWDYQGRSHQPNPDNRTVSYWDSNQIPLPLRKNLTYVVLPSLSIGSGEGIEGTIATRENSGYFSKSAAEFVRETPGLSNIRSGAQAIAGAKRNDEAVEVVVGTVVEEDELYLGGWKESVKEYAESAGLVLREDEEEGESSPRARRKTAGPLTGGEKGSFMNTNPFYALFGFHFLGAVETSEQLFSLFYGPPLREVSKAEDRVFPPVRVAAQSLLRSYTKFRRWEHIKPSLLAVGVEPAGEDETKPTALPPPTHTTDVDPSRGLIAPPKRKHSYEPPLTIHISYADGCCQKAIKKNLASGRSFFDRQIAYDRSAFDPAWAKQHEEILAVKRGGGLWIWKPYVVLKTLLDPATPWDASIVYLDAGNHFTADPLPFVKQTLAMWSPR